MQKRLWILLIVLIVIGVVVAAALYFWSPLSQALPHPNLLKAWVNYLAIDLNIGRWGPIAVLLLVAVIELVWALNLGRQSGASERQMNRLDRLHAREIEVFNQEIALLKDERRALRAELELREGLIREEKTRLWAQFEDLQRMSGITLGKLLTLDAPDPTPEVRGDWRQSISQLERIEMVASVTVRKGPGALQLQQRADDLVRLGNACFRLDQYERALTHYSAAIELSPNDPESLINHAVANHALGQHQPALQDLEAALRLEEHSWAYLYRGLIREHLDEDKRAQEDYGRALRLDPEFVEAYYRRGLLHAKAKEYEKAFQDQNQALALDEDHAGAYTARGVIRAAMDDSQWALNDLDKGCTLAPERCESFYQRGGVRHQLEMYDGALEDYARVIELDPIFALAFKARGDTYMAMEEHWQAIADYGQMIELQPKNATGYYARGVARAATREYRRAIEDFDQALELDPGLAIALADRGAAHEKLGEYAQAIQDLDRAVALDPNLAIAYYNRGLAYGSKGEYDRASRDLNKAVELDPSLGNRKQGVLETGPA